MNKHRVFLVFFLFLTGFVSFALVPRDVYATAVVWTDKADYQPWETVTIYGSGFNPNTNIDIDITRPDSVVDTGSAMSGGSGNFLYYYVLNGMFGTYTVIATDGVNSATTTFTEAVHVDFKQYANVWDLWIGSILQGAKSTYYEGISVPQRVIFVDIASTTGDVHSLDFSHQATKGGIHAYDWLTAWNQGNVPPLTYTPCGDNIGPHATTAMCQALHLKTGSYEIFVNVPNDPFISKDGSTQTRINAYEAAYGNRQIRICGNQPITSASFSAISHDVASPGGDTGDSYILYTLTWTSASDQILIEMAGHLAVSGDPVANPIAWGVGLGSGQIGGGPYHFKLGTLDGHSLGSQDNQIMGADVILPALGKVTVVKDAVPDDPEDFSFTTDLGAGFILDDDADVTYSNTEVFSNVATGSYYVTEGSEAWWTLTSIGIAGDDDYTSGNTGTRTATIYVDPGEDITITFANELALPEKASIGDFVWKDLDGAGIQDAGEPGFQGVTVELYTSTHTLVGTTTTNVGGSYSFTNLDPGNYYLKFHAPSGYVFSSQDQGTDDAKDSDASPSTGQTAVTTLTSGETDNTWDAGIRPPPVGGVWVSINKFELLAPWIGLATSMTVAVASIVYCARRKKEQS